LTGRAADVTYKRHLVDSPLNGYGNYRYGTWSDLLGGTVPKGNGDNPVIGQVNRLYVRVRNYGNKPASNVTVYFDVTSPLGLGISGPNAFLNIPVPAARSLPSLDF